jgi:hypothetical protein
MTTAARDAPAPHGMPRGMAAAARARRRPTRPGVRPGVQQLLDAMTDVPAFVQNRGLDVPAANPLARALHADLFDDAGPGSAGRAPNHARDAFLDPSASACYPDWNRVASGSVCAPRSTRSPAPNA